MKLPGILTGITGEYLVAAALSRRGYVASLTLRNTRGIDILVSNKDATKAVGIQVKTSQPARPEWVMTKKAEADLAENLFYVFVCLMPEKPDAFHIVPRRVVARHVRESHKRWLATPGKRARVRCDSDLRKFRDPTNAYRDRWDLLGL